LYELQVIAFLQVFVVVGYFLFCLCARVKHQHLTKRLAAGEVVIEKATTELAAKLNQYFGDPCCVKTDLCAASKV